jgi:hypothetical protein
VRDAKRRLERLEAEAGKGALSRWEVPIGLRAYLTMVARCQARTEGKEPPEYSWEEIEEMRRQDLETVSGIGADASSRDSIGWQTPEAERMLDEWQEDARRRVQKAEGLPPERWGEIWGVDEK